MTDKDIKEYIDKSLLKKEKDKDKDIVAPLVKFNTASAINKVIKDGVKVQYNNMLWDVDSYYENKGIPMVLLKNSQNMSYKSYDRKAQRYLIKETLSKIKINLIASIIKNSFWIKKNNKWKVYNINY
jgi:hypothetical protein